MKASSDSVSSRVRWAGSTRRSTSGAAVLEGRNDHTALPEAPRKDSETAPGAHARAARRACSIEAWRITTRSAQPPHGVDRASALPDLEVEDRTLERAGVPGPADDLAGDHLLAAAHRGTRQVGVQRVPAAAVVEDDHLAVRAVVRARVVDAAARHRVDGLAGGGPDVDPVVERHRAEARMLLVAVATDDLAAQGPGELALALLELALVGGERLRRLGALRLGAAALLLLATLPFQLGEQGLDAARRLLEVGRGGLVFLALALDPAHRLLLLLGQAVEALLLLGLLAQRLVDLLVGLVEPRLVPLDPLLLLGDAEQDAAVLARDPGQKVPAREELGEGTGRQDELELAGAAVLVEVPQALGEAAPLVAQAGPRAGEIGARALELALELELARGQALHVRTRVLELAFGRAQLLQDLALPGLERGGLLALLGGLAADVLELAALLVLLVPIRRRGRGSRCRLRGRRRRGRGRLGPRVGQIGRRQEQRQPERGRAREAGTRAPHASASGSR